MTRRRALRAALAVVAAAALLAASAAAAVRALHATAADAPAPRLRHAGGPLFELPALAPGDRAVRCLRLVNDGAGPALVSVFGEGRDGGLARHLRLAVSRGCDGGELVWEGPLDAYPPAGAAVADPVALPAGEERGYRLAVELTGRPRGGAKLEQTFAAGAVGAEPGARSATAASTTCATLALGGRARGGVLVKRARIRGRIAAKLILRVFGRGLTQRLVMVTGLRVGDRWLPGRRWARVTYAIDGRVVAAPRRRPFHARTVPGQLRPGVRVVTARVVPRHGSPVSVGFRLTITGAQTRCTIG